METTLILSLALLILSIQVAGGILCIPFILWKLKKLEDQVDKLDAALAETMETVVATRLEKARKLPI